MQCYCGAIIRLGAAWRHRLACAGEIACRLAVAACRPAVECYRPRQTTTTDAREKNNTGLYTMCRRASNNVTNLYQLTLQSTTSCPTTWRSYRDHRLLWRHFTLCIQHDLPVSLRASCVQEYRFRFPLAEHLSCRSFHEQYGSCCPIHCLHWDKTISQWKIILCRFHITHALGIGVNHGGKGGSSPLRIWEWGR